LNLGNGKLSTALVTNLLDAIKVAVTTIDKGTVIFGRKQYQGRSKSGNNVSVITGNKVTVPLNKLLDDPKVKAAIDEIRKVSTDFNESWVKDLLTNDVGGKLAEIKGGDVTFKFDYDADRTNNAATTYQANSDDYVPNTQLNQAVDAQLYATGRSPQTGAVEAQSTIQYAVNNVLKLTTDPIVAQLIAQSAMNLYQSGIVDKYELIASLKGQLQQLTEMANAYRAQLANSIL